MSWRSWIVMRAVNDGITEEGGSESDHGTGVPCRFMVISSALVNFEIEPAANPHILHVLRTTTELRENFAICDPTRSSRFVTNANCRRRREQKPN